MSSSLYLIKPNAIIDINALNGSDVVNSEKYEVMQSKYLEKQLFLTRLNRR